jgi:hypothetical protein
VIHAKWLIREFAVNMLITASFRRNRANLRNVEISFESRWGRMCYGLCYARNVRDRYSVDWGILSQTPPLPDGNDVTERRKETLKNKGFDNPKSGASANSAILAHG